MRAGFVFLGAVVVFAIIGVIFLRASDPDRKTTTLPPTSESPNYYVAEEGDSYADIAAARGISEEDLRSANMDRGIGAGTIVVFPSGSVSTTVRTTPDAQPTGVITPTIATVENLLVEQQVAGNPPGLIVRTMEPGIPLAEIAERFGVEAIVIVEANYFNEDEIDNIPAGRLIVVPGGQQ